MYVLSNNNNNNNNNSKPTANTRERFQGDYRAEPRRSPGAGMCWTEYMGVPLVLFNNVIR